MSKTQIKPLVGVPAVLAFHKEQADRYIVASVRDCLRESPSAKKEPVKPVAEAVRKHI